MAGEKVEMWVDLMATLMAEQKELMKGVRKVALKVGQMAAARVSCSDLKWVDEMVGVMAVPWVRGLAALKVAQWVVLLDAALVALWAVLMAVVLAAQLDRRLSISNLPLLLLQPHLCSTQTFRYCKE